MLDLSSSDVLVSTLVLETSISSPFLHLYEHIFLPGVGELETYLSPENKIMISSIWTSISL